VQCAVLGVDSEAAPIATWIVYELAVVAARVVHAVAVAGAMVGDAGDGGVRDEVYATQRREKAVPKLASGFSCFILSRQSWLKYMYAERARLGAFGSFLCEPPRGVLSDFLAALRVWGGWT
jgi:hypothetical protein